MNIRKTVAIAAAGAIAVVGLGTSGAVAGKMIGSKQLKQNAVKSKHIKNGTIKKKDIKPRLVDRFTDAGVDYASMEAPTTLENIGGSIKERYTDLGTEVELKKGTYLISVEGSFINQEALSGEVEVYPQVSVWIDKNGDEKFDWSTDPAENEGSISPNAVMPTAASRHIQFSGSTVLELDKKQTVRIVGFGYDSDQGTEGQGNVTVNDALLTAEKIG